MCTTCGCGCGGSAHMHVHVDEHGNVTAHVHDGHDHEHGHAHDGMPAHSHAHTTDARRAVAIEEDILSRNNAAAAVNRTFFREHGILALNLVSSPGSGKTELLARTLKDAQKFKTAVIEGDQQTDNDAERIRATGARALQINTGRGCHLDAAMIAEALKHLRPEDGSVLFIENVGNLVCPAEFDLGEAHKVVLLSVTEGEDKPIKYPDMFRAADLMILTKTDLLPYVPFDADRAEEYARRVNPRIRTIRVSAMTGEGMEKWLVWIAAELMLSGI